jgi:hypothetical protein
MFRLTFEKCEGVPYIYATIIMHPCWLVIVAVAVVLAWWL